MRPTFVKVSIVISKIYIAVLPINYGLAAKYLAGTGLLS